MKRRYLREPALKLVLVVGCILAAVILAVYAVRLAGATTAKNVVGRVDGLNEGFILVDPGHGGADGGASAADGTLEKDVNLAISLPLADMLRFLGYPVEMTRETDCSIHDPDVTTLKNQKVSDMKNRLKLYNASRLTISIHENQFPQTQYFGTQIFYGTNSGESKLLADCVRTSVIGLLQPDNTRELKKGTKDIYLLHNAEVPVILVECGFLSNTGELQKLKNPSYQQDMAYAIVGGVLAYDA